MRAIVVGAGIGGLTTALSLQQRGIAVDVFERSDAVRELGVGFNILPPAVAELAKLGLLDALDATGIRTSTLIMTTARGGVVLRDPRGLAAGYEVPQYSIHRGRLQRLLADALTSRTSTAVIHVDHRLIRFEQDDDVVRTHFVDRAGRSRPTVEGDVLIGADGINSVVRAQLEHRDDTPRWNGLMMWRGATPWETILDGRTMILAGGSDAKFVVYPIAPERGRKRLTNWGVVGRVAPPGTPPPPPRTNRDVWSQPGRRDELAPHLARFTSDLVDIAGLARATDPIYEYPMCDRDPLRRWSHGRVTLLGDAAHPMYPMGSNGATQAIIDASFVADRLAQLDVVDALAAYERDRREATGRLVLMNRIGGPERVIDLVEALAPDGFDKIDDVIPEDDLRQIVAEYAAASQPPGAIGPPLGRRENLAPTGRQASA